MNLHATSTPKAGDAAVLLKRKAFWRFLVLSYVGVTSVLLFDVMMRIQLPIVDNFHALSVSLGSSWPQALWDGFVLNRHGQHALEYRPLFFLTAKALHQLGGSHDLLVFRMALALAWGLLGTAMVWILRPATLSEFIAFFIAYHALFAIHTAGAFYGLEPISPFLLAQVGIFGALALLRTSGGRVQDFAAPLIAFAALFLVELGAMVSLTLIAGFLLGYKGISRRGVAMVLAAATAYAVLRLAIIPVPQQELPYGSRYYDETGFLCEKIDTNAQYARFGDFPYPFYAYNVVANGMTVLFSEPRGGLFVFGCNLLDGRTPPLFTWVLIATSVLSTAIIGLWWTAAPRGDTDKRFALLVLLGFAANLGVGFLYARDRVPAAAGAAYSLLLYFALRYWFRWLAATRRPVARAIVAGAIVAVLAGWSWRTLGVGYALRHYAWDARQEWLGPRYDQLKVKWAGDAPRLALLDALKTRALSHAVPDPRYDPPWIRRLLSDR